MFVSEFTAAKKFMREGGSYFIFLLPGLVFSTYSVFSTGRDIASITHLEVKCILFLKGSETNVPTHFLSVLNTAYFNQHLHYIFYDLNQLKTHR